MAERFGSSIIAEAAVDLQQAVARPPECVFSGNRFLFAQRDQFLGGKILDQRNAVVVVVVFIGLVRACVVEGLIDFLQSCVVCRKRRKTRGAAGDQQKQR